MKRIALIFVLLLSLAGKAQQFTFSSAEKQELSTVIAAKAAFTVKITQDSIAIQNNTPVINGGITELDVLNLQLNIVKEYSFQAGKRVFLVENKQINVDPQDFTYTLTVEDEKITLQSLNLIDTQIYSFFK